MVSNFDDDLSNGFLTEIVRCCCGVLCKSQCDTVDKVGTVGRDDVAVLYSTPAPEPDHRSLNLPFPLFMPKYPDLVPKL